MRWFELLPSRIRRRALVASVALAVAMLVVLALLDGPLRNDVAGSGIISLELAGSPGRAGEIVASWRAEGVLDQAVFGLGLDYLYAVVYGLALAIGCLAAGLAWRDRGRQRIADAAPVLAKVALAAAALDWVENTALAVVLINEPVAPWPAIALVGAIPKFAGVAAALAFAAAGGLVALRGRRP